MNSITHEVTHLDSLLRRAALFGETGRWHDAIPLLQSALLVQPDNAHLYCRMAQAQFQINAIRRAMAYIEQALSLDPAHVWAHQWRCTILLKRRKIRLILRAAEEMLALNPDNASSLSLMTRALLKAGKPSRAREMAERLRQAAPNSTQSHEAFVLVAFKQNQWIEAEIHCREMLKINPLSAAAFNNLGLALRYSGRSPEAIQCLLEAQRLDPTAVRTRYALKSAVSNYLFGSDAVTCLLAGAVFCIFFGCLPLGNRATYGPVWLHTVLFVLAPVLLIVAFLFIRHRLNKLPPAAWQYALPAGQRHILPCILSKKKIRNDIEP